MLLINLYIWDARAQSRHYMRTYCGHFRGQRMYLEQRCGTLLHPNILTYCMIVLEPPWRIIYMLILLTKLIAIQQVGWNMNKMISCPSYILVCSTHDNTRFRCGNLVEQRYSSLPIGSILWRTLKIHCPSITIG